MADLPTRNDVIYVVRQPPSITRTQMLPAWPKWILVNTTYFIAGYLVS